MAQRCPRQLGGKGMTVEADETELAKSRKTKRPVGFRRRTHNPIVMSLKRGLVGIYQHVDKRHLNRYLAEFDFRQNTRAKLGIDDVERTKRAISGMAGKRLTYLDSSA
jgi:hypothetical protein